MTPLHAALDARLAGLALAPGDLASARALAATVEPAGASDGPRPLALLAAVLAPGPSREAFLAGACCFMVPGAALAAWSLLGPLGLTDPTVPPPRAPGVPSDVALDAEASRWGVLFAAAAAQRAWDPERWRDLGSRFARACSLVTGAEDFFAGTAPSSELWPVRWARHHRDATLAWLAAGPLEPADLAVIRARLHDADLPAAILRALDADADALTEPLLAPFVARLKGSRNRLAWIFLRASPPGPLEPLARTVRRATAAARSFLRDDPKLEECVELRRDPRFAPATRAEVFGRLLIAEALAPVCRALARRAAGLALARAEPGGLRYYRDLAAIPFDADDAGLALQLAPLLATTRRTLLRRLARRVVAAERDGSFPTWLPDATTDPADAAIWVARPCDGVRAHVLLGLHAHDPADHGPVLARGARALARAVRDDALASPNYPPPVVEALALRALDTLDLPGTARARRALSARVSRRCVRGEETALVLAVSLRAARLSTVPPAALRRLLEAQAPDGGFPADPMFTVPPHHGPRWFGARSLTTALVLRALAETDVPDAWNPAAPKPFARLTPRGPRR